MRHVTSVVRQDANRCSASAAEHKQASRERVLLQLLLAQSGKRVDALAAIHGLDRHQNPHLRCDLNHGVCQNARLSPARSGAVVPFHWMRTLPRRPSNSIRHSARPAAGDVSSSTNAGGAVDRARRGAAAGAFAPLFRATGPGASTNCFNLPYSKRKTFAVGKTPCCRANSTVAAYKPFGIGKRPVCALRQCSKRRETSRILLGISDDSLAIVGPPCLRSNPQAAET